LDGMQTGVLVFFCLVATHKSQVQFDIPAPFTDDCILDHGTNLYDPKKAEEVRWYDVDLDAPASERFVQIAKDYTDSMNALIQVVKDFIVPVFPNAVEFIDDIFGEMHKILDQPYKDEIEGISRASGIPLGQIVMYNLIYEIMAGCTSVVAVDDNCKVFNARNLDFGLWIRWNPAAHEWELSRALSNNIVNLRWMRGGKVMYKSNNFAGFVGIYNGVKQGAFALTANARGGTANPIQKWLDGDAPNAKWMTWLTRETMESNTTYADAKKHLMNTELLSNVFYILSGTKPDEACVISRSHEKTEHLTEITSHKDSWFILQTNYEQDYDPWWIDDRQLPGMNCMRTLGKKNFGFPGLYNVLSSRTNLNKLTAYTALMHIDTGDFETYLQNCSGDCWGW
ncbi:hypothetical protein PENTCL1PPCAC_20604, partial [Pristionchus entomophagus]